MRRHTLDDATAERLLRGSAPADRPELEPLSVLLSQVRDLAGTAPQPTPALETLLRDGFEPSAATAPVPAPVRSPLRRRLAAVAGLSLGLKVLTGTGVALAGVTTAAGAGVLPDAVQDRVSSVVRTVTPFELDPPPAAPVAPADERVADPAPQGPDGEGPAHGEPTLPDQAPMDEPPRTVPPQRPAAPGNGPREDGPRSDRAPEERPAPAPQERPNEGPRTDGPAKQGPATSRQSQRQAPAEEAPTPVDAPAAR